MITTSSFLCVRKAFGQGTLRFLSPKSGHTVNNAAGFLKRKQGVRHYHIREGRAYQSVVHSDVGFGAKNVAVGNHGVKSTTAAGVDEDLMQKSLNHASIFAKRHTEKLPQVMMYEIDATGKSCLRKITLRALLQFVNDTIPELNLFTGAAQHFPATEISPTNPLLKGINSHNVKGSSRGPVPEKSSEEEHTVIGGLRLRDLRRLDFLFNPNEERAVLIRRHAVLFAIDPVRAVVMADRLMLIVPENADSMVSILDRYMKEWVQAKRANAEELNNYPYFENDLVDHDTNSDADFDMNSVDSDVVMKAHQQLESSTASNTANSTSNSTANSTDVHCTNSNTNVADDSKIAPTERQIKLMRKAMTAASDLPFEVHAYEALLTTVTVLETQEFNRVNAQVQVILGYFRSGSLLPIEVQEEMRNRKNDLSRMLSRISSARNTIHQLTEDDEDMALMNLSMLHRKPTLYYLPLVPAILSKHDEIEELLESYLIDFNALESKIEYARSQIQNAEELLSIRLDIARNELLVANTLLALAACSFGLGAYISGIFGMNLDNTLTIQNTPHLFYAVIGGTSVVMLVGFAGMVALFKRNGTFPRRLKLVNRDMFKFRARDEKQ